MSNSPRRWLAFVLLFACAGCPGDPPADPEAPAEERTRRQKDSIVAKLPVRGAGAVGRALDILDESRVRAEAHDTIS